MPWSGGSYSKWNQASGGWAGDAAAGVGIEAGRHDSQDNDFKDGINNCLAKDGTNSMTGNLNLGGYLPTNVGAGTAAAPAYCAANDTNTGMFSPTADNIAFATNGSERVRIDSIGQVGIGTTTPSYQFDIQGASGACVSSMQRFSNDATGAQFILRKSRGATVGTNTIIQNGDVCGGIYFQGNNGSSWNLSSSITGEIDGTPGASNDMPGRLIFSTTADGSGTATERMRIDNGGRLYVNTVTVRNAGLINVDFAASSNYGAFGINDTTSANGAVFAGFLTGGVFRGSITNSNNTAVAYNTTSDYRLKENSRPITNGLNRVLALNPVKFDWIGTNLTSEGFIAHELAIEVPDAVTGEKDAVDADGNPRYQGVDYGKLTTILTAAIQELNAKVEALEARVAVLEG